MQASRTIYYLPGYGGCLETGLGQALTQRGFDLAGRETTGTFRLLGFQDQIDLIVFDLQSHFWAEDAHVVANSFGAYLFLHAQSQLAPFPGHVLLLSPIIGEFENTENAMNFIPPRADLLGQLAREGKMPVPRHCEIHVGEHDWQSEPKCVSRFGNLLGIPVEVVAGNGHMLDKNYVSGVLDRWLPSDRDETLLRASTQ